ncbi:MAG: L-2-amino-thiazoline-4-carboxylic acid hydrolase [Christensenellaceae bacterium]|jgi:hypothetical protein|nr:L-2-amino-thiazoline-4-carboxylic acid hydrolase [Christensenellaceae bacterium]
MSNIVNEAKLKNFICRGIRGQLEHRALWLYYLVDEAKKLGVDPSLYAGAAINRCGRYQGAELHKVKTMKNGLVGFRKTLFTRPTQWMFEMKVVESTPDALKLNFHYCPLVKAWQKIGLSDEEIKELCATAMCGDRGLAESQGAELVINKTIADGDGYCDIQFIAKKD